MNFSNSSIFIVVLVMILLIISVGQKYLENFDPNLSQSFQPVNYNTLEQDCNQLTWSPSKCTVETVVPKGENVCNDDLTPMTNNLKEYKKKKKDLKKSPTLSLQYDFDLLSSFNNAQISNPDEENNQYKAKNLNNYELITDIRSLNSLENDLISNY